MPNLVEVARFYDPEEALCAASYLRAHGIETILQNEHHLTMAPYLRIALNGYGLLARTKQQDDARNALNEIANATPDSIGAENRKNRNWWYLPAAFGTAAPFLPVYRSRTVFLLQTILIIGFAAGMTYYWGLAIYSLFLVLTQ